MIREDQESINTSGVAVQQSCEQQQHHQSRVITDSSSTANNKDIMANISREDDKKRQKRIEMQQFSVNLREIWTSIPYSLPTVTVTSSDHSSSLQQTVVSQHRHNEEASPATSSSSSSTGRNTLSPAVLIIDGKLADNTFTHSYDPPSSSNTQWTRLHAYLLQASQAHPSTLPQASMPLSMPFSYSSLRDTQPPAGLALHSNFNTQQVHTAPSVIASQIPPVVNPNTILSNIPPFKLTKEEKRLLRAFRLHYYSKEQCEYRALMRQKYPEVVGTSVSKAGKELIDRLLAIEIIESDDEDEDEDVSNPPPPLEAPSNEGNVVDNPIPTEIINPQLSEAKLTNDNQQGLEVIQQVVVATPQSYEETEVDGD